MFCYLLHDSSQKKRQRNKEKKDKEAKKDEEVATDAAASKSGERKQSFLQVRPSFLYTYILFGVFFCKIKTIFIAYVLLSCWEPLMSSLQNAMQCDDHHLS